MAVFGVLLLAAAANGAEPVPGSYRVVGGKVDQNTFQGWRVYQSSCYLCHGVGATGSEVAPSLLQRIEQMTPREFAERVLVRYRLDTETAVGSVEERERKRAEIIEEVKAKKRGPKGRISMPAWETDAQVNAHILDLFAYLSARADGAIGVDRPGVLKPGE